MPEKMTNTFVKNIPIREKKFDITDSTCTGLTLRVFPSGTKTYYYKYRPKGIKNANLIKVGDARIMTVSKAREAIAALQGDLAKGVDLAHRQRERIDSEKKSRLEKQLNSDLQFFNYIDKYYRPYALKRNKTAVDSIKTLKREFSLLADKRIDLIDGRDIDRWRSSREKQIKHARIQRIFNILRSCINTAVKYYKLIDKHSLERYSIKRYQTETPSQKKLRYLLPEEEPRLLAALADRDQEQRNYHALKMEWALKRSPKMKQRLFKGHEYPDYVTPIIIIAYKTGFDMGDIFDLLWEEHIDMHAGRIRKIRNKTANTIDNPRPVVVSMSPQVKAVLKQWGKQHGTTGRVFKSEVTGGKIKNINHQWNKIRSAAGLENFRLKDFRHTFGSWLALAGTYPTVIRDLMGHTDLKTTQIYLHLCPSRHESAVAAVFD